MIEHSRGFIAIFVVCALALFGLEAVLRSNPRERNYEAFTEMVYSRASESLSASDVLPGGMTQQPIEEGVVVRGRMPFPFGLGLEEAQRAGRELRNPFAPATVDAPLDPAVLARGAEVYRVFCVVCHAADGMGRGSVVMRGMLPPPSFKGAHAIEIADGEMFHILTRGQGNMASYAAQVSADDRWKVIRHIRTLQEVKR
jgi:mono/diheme cytochrome c family protein